METIFYYISQGFTFSFLIELLIKLTAYSFKDFTANRFNVFDSVIVLISLVDLFIAQIFPGLTIFRAFRLVSFYSILMDEEENIMQYHR